MVINSVLEEHSKSKIKRKDQYHLAFLLCDIISLQLSTIPPKHSHYNVDSMFGLCISYLIIGTNMIIP